jgi:prepilin-type N-terminal cleavage/methylation domain-containing protein
MVSEDTVTKPGQGGFTVVEVMITLAIVALFVVMVTPTIRSSINEHRALAMVSALKTDLEFARNHAISTNQLVKFNVDNAKKSVCNWKVGTWSSADLSFIAVLRIMDNAQLGNYSGVSCVFTFTDNKQPLLNGLGINTSGSSFSALITAAATTRKWELTLQTSGNLKVVAK